jgi:hypothetical protein
MAIERRHKVPNLRGHSHLSRPRSQRRAKVSRQRDGLIIDACISNVLSEAQKKRTMVNEGTQQLFLALQGAAAAAGNGGQFGDFMDGAIG